MAEQGHCDSAMSFVLAAMFPGTRSNLSTIVSSAACPLVDLCFECMKEYM